MYCFSYSFLFEKQRLIWRCNNDANHSKYYSIKLSGCFF